MLLCVCPDIASPDPGQVGGQGGQHHGQLHQDGEEGDVEGVLNKVEVSINDCIDTQDLTWKDDGIPQLGPFIYGQP